MKDLVDLHRLWFYAVAVKTKAQDFGTERLEPVNLHLFSLQKINGYLD